MTTVANPSSAWLELIQLDERRYAAMVAGDADALDGMLTIDLTYTHSDGRTDTKASYLGAVRARALRYHRCDRESAEGEIHGDVAIVHGVVCLRALDQGMEKAIRIHYLANWVRSARTDWQLRAWASTLIERLS